MYNVEEVGGIMKNFKISKTSVFIYILILVNIFIFDQLTKIFVAANMQLGMSHPIIEDFFYFTYAHNYGAAWSMLSGQAWLFILIAIAACIGITYYFFKTKEIEILTRLGLVLALSGTIGNLVDRICFGYVRDFIDFIIFGYDFPIFNIADMALVIGVGLIILDMYLEERRMKLEEKKWKQ